MDNSQQEPASGETSKPEFSFDIGQFRKRLDGNDDWNHLIQGHLFLDHVITRMLEEALKHPEKIALDRMTFSTKLDLSSALGLIDDQTEGLLRRVNRLRNSMAHDLHFVVTEQHANEIRDLCSDYARELIDEDEWSVTDSLLRKSLVVNVILLDIARQGWMKFREQERRREEGLRAAMENAQRVLERYYATAGEHQNNMDNEKSRESQ